MSSQTCLQTSRDSTPKYYPASTKKSIAALADQSTTSPGMNIRCKPSERCNKLSGPIEFCSSFSGTRTARCSGSLNCEHAFPVDTHDKSIACRFIQGAACSIRQAQPLFADYNSATRILQAWLTCHSIETGIRFSNAERRQYSIGLARSHLILGSFSLRMHRLNCRPASD